MDQTTRQAADPIVCRATEETTAPAKWTAMDQTIRHTADGAAGTDTDEIALHTAGLAADGAARPIAYGAVGPTTAWGISTTTGRTACRAMYRNMDRTTPGTVPRIMWYPT